MAQSHTFAGTNFVAYPITTPDGTVAYLLATTALDSSTGTPAPSGSSTSPMYVLPQQNTYQLATAQTLTAGSNAGTTANVIGGSYIWDVDATGPFTLVLESLKSGGTNWGIVFTATGPGDYGVVIGNNATVRIRNAGGSSITSLSASLS